MSIFRYFTPISTALLPNVEIDDIQLVLSFLLPWNWSNWREGKKNSEFENIFSKYFGIKSAVSFSSGRVGLYAILKSISDFQNQDSIAKRSEIIIQAYTTIALPLAIKKAGFTPVYADIKEDTLNIDPDEIEKKITSQTKAVIVQHTFGIPAEMDKIMAICKRHNLFLIEDCAHSLGAEYGGKKIGVFGDASFFSFGRDKIISSTSGGMVITNNEKLAEKIREFQGNLNFPPLKWIFRQLMHPLIFWCALPAYYFFNIGKYKIFLYQKLGIISRAYSAGEKKGDDTVILGYKFPNALAKMALNQFNKLERFNDHRKKISEIYQSELYYDNMNNHSKIKIPLVAKDSKPTFLYYTIQIERRDELLKFAAKKHIILGDWFPGALGPKGVDEARFGYKKGDCPVAERIGLKSLNLPTNIKTSEADARMVIKAIKIFFSNNKKNGSY